MSTTDQLFQVLNQSGTDELSAFLKAYEAKLLPESKAFATYMRLLLDSKGLKRQDIFVASDIPERYGYKLLSEEKHTKKRDIILRLCIASGFTLQETQRALEIYGMARLYPRSPRDSVFILAINNRINDVHEVDDLLGKHGFENLARCGMDGDLD